MKMKLLLAVLSVMFLASGCGLFKEKCDCPKFNYLPPTEQAMPEDPCA